MSTAALPKATQFKQVLLWPVQLIPSDNNRHIQKYWEIFAQNTINSAWQEVTDEFFNESTQLSENCYQEFVTFLPYAQRFLYGEGKHGLEVGGHERSPIHSFERKDVASVRVTLNKNSAPVIFKVGKINLHFFFDIDVAVLSLEVVGENIELPTVMDMLFRFGRTYPSYWDQHDNAGNCVQKVEWLDAEQKVLAESDYSEKSRYLTFVKTNHVPYIASHWSYLIAPLVQHYSDKEGLLRYREIEYQHMPIMCFLALDEVEKLTRGDMVRLGLAAPYNQSNSLPYPEEFLRDFEKNYCYDRYWGQQPDAYHNTRYICTEQSLIVLGSAKNPFFVNDKMGSLGQFNNQFFLLFLIAHFQKSSLLMVADRLVQAISHLDIDNPESIKNFRLDIRHIMEIFLRFTHRYYFQEVSDKVVARDLFMMMNAHGNTEQVFEKTRRRVMDMQEYLEAEELRRQADTVVRLTVVTILGLIGTMTTGILGMNLFDLAHEGAINKMTYFILIFIPVMTLTFYTVIKSRRLSVFLDALSDERVSSLNKVKVLAAVWAKKSLDL